MPRRNNNNPNALSDFDTAFANADDALTAAVDATQTDANNDDSPTTTAIATQPPAFSSTTPSRFSFYAV